MDNSWEPGDGSGIPKGVFSCVGRALYLFMPYFNPVRQTVITPSLQMRKLRLNGDSA